MDDDIRRLLDEAAIRKVHLRYCRGVDRLDWDLVRSCYHPDAIDDHGEYVGGVEGFIDYCKAGTAQFLSTTHFTGNQLVEVDGDRAWAEHYARAYHRVPAGEDGKPRDFAINCRYIDDMERRDGEWRIARRVVVVDADRVDPVAESWVPEEQMRGRRGRADPSYRASG